MFRGMQRRRYLKPWKWPASLRWWSRPNQRRFTQMACSVGELNAMHFVADTFGYWPWWQNFPFNNLYALLLRGFHDHHTAQEHAEAAKAKPCKTLMLFSSWNVSSVCHLHMKKWNILGISFFLWIYLYESLRFLLIFLLFSMEMFHFFSFFSFGFSHFLPSKRALLAGMEIGPRPRGQAWWTRMVSLHVHNEET